MYHSSLNFQGDEGSLEEQMDSSARPKTQSTWESDAG